MSADTETCPTCNTPGATNLGIFCHCEFCNYLWYVESPDIDVTEAHPAVKLIRGWLADESGNDERTWPLVEKTIRDNPV